MPPKVKVTKEEILSAALDLTREAGFRSVNPRSVATRLGCSTQPVFSNFPTVDRLRLALLERADILCRDYIRREVESGEYPPYKASGMAYIRFAKEEKELFQLLYMRDRTNDVFPRTEELFQQMEQVVQNHTGLDEDASRLFHLEMWAYVHGIAAMLATGFVCLEWDLISRMLTDAYLGLRKQYGKE